MWNLVYTLWSYFLPVLGLVALVVGWYGRTVMTGVEMPGSARLHLRHKRLKLVALGLVLFLTPICGNLAYMRSGWAQARNNARKPTGVLVMEAYWSQAPFAGLSIGELATRIGTDRMSDQTARALLARALEVQADPNAAWVPQWGDVVVACFRAGVCDAKTYARFIRRGIRCTYETRSVARAGDTIRSQLSLEADRLGSSGHRVKVALEEWIINGQRGSSTGERSLSVSFGGGFGYGGLVTMPDQPGEVVVNVSYTLRLDDASLGGLSGSDLEWTESFERRITVVPSEERSVALSQTESAVDLSRAISIEAATFDRADEENTSLSMMLVSRSLPVAVSARVRAFCTLADGRMVEVDLGPAVCRSGGESVDYTPLRAAAGIASGVDVTHVRVVLTPDPEPAEETFDVQRVWMGPALEFDAVPIEDFRHWPMDVKRVKTRPLVQQGRQPLPTGVGLR